MSLFDFLTASENLPFLWSLILMLFVGLVEGLSSFLGLALSGLFDGLFPEAEVPEAGFMTQAFGWLYLGKLPLLMVIVVALAVFGCVGLLGQLCAQTLLGFLLPSLLAVLAAFMISLPLIRITNGVLIKVMPREQSDAVSANTFVGRIAVLGAASAQLNLPAQAKLHDQHGQAHYILVEPDDPQHVFASGEEVLLVRRDGAKFFAISNPNAALSRQN